MADTITIRTAEKIKHTLDVLTHDGSSRSAAIRQTVFEAARRRRSRAPPQRIRRKAQPDIEGIETER
jgi:hypothetical protein